MNDKPESPVRLFTGIALNDSARDHVVGIVKRLSGELPGVRWVPEENLHVTLKFLGQCDPSIVDELSLMLREAARFLPLRLEIGCVGAFPSTGSARVLWVGAGDQEGRAREVYRALDKAAVKHGIAREKRRYTPHVTVGRSRKKPVSIPVEFALRFRDTVTLDVNHIVLFRSEPGSTDAEYTVVEKMPPLR